MRISSPRFRALLALCCVTLGYAGSGRSQTVPEHMQLFLLIGQSNMAGRGVVEPDQQPNPHIFMLTEDRQWVPAKDPMHFDKPKAIGVGPGLEFARTISTANPSADIGLIPCAFGGTSLDQWKPGGKLYNDAVTRARESMKHGTLTGILWHQGEADSKHEKVVTYAERFAAMIAQLRRDLSAENVPVIIGELGHFRPDLTEFNAAVPDIASHVPRCAYVTAEDLTDKGDHLHFDTASQRKLGQRYAAAFTKLAAAAPQPPPGTTGTK